MKRFAVVMFAALFVTGMLSVTLAQSPVREGRKESAGSGGTAKTEETAKLLPGAYDQVAKLEFSKEKDGFNGTGVMKMQLDLMADGTFTLVAYVTSKELQFDNQLFIKLRGKWKQQADRIVESDLEVQYYDLGAKTMSAWGPPETGKTTDNARIRNVTKTTFEEFDPTTKKWVTWNKR